MTNQEFEPLKKHKKNNTLTNILAVWMLPDKKVAEVKIQVEF